MAIHPFAHVMSSENSDLAAAVVRAAEGIDLRAVDGLVDAVSEEAYGRMLMTPGQRESHKRLLRLRYERDIVPAAERARRLLGRA